MNIGRRARVTAARSAPALFLVLVTTVFGAARAMEPDSVKTAGFFGEVSACLAVGLLVLASGRCTGVAHRVLGTGRVRTTRVAKNLIRGAVGALRESALVCALATPVLAAAWESGGSLQQVLGTTIGLGSAVVFGIALGIFMGSMKIPPPLGVCLAVSTGALLLWPRALGWASGLTPRFPAPETRPAILVLVLFAAVLGATLRSYSRTRHRVTG